MDGKIRNARGAAILLAEMLEKEKFDQSDRYCDLAEQHQKMCAAIAEVKESLASLKRQMEESSERLAKLARHTEEASTEDDDAPVLLPPAQVPELPTTDPFEKHYDQWTLEHTVVGRDGKRSHAYKEQGAKQWCKNRPPSTAVPGSRVSHDYLCAAFSAAGFIVVCLPTACKYGDDDSDECIKKILDKKE